MLGGSGSNFDGPVTVKLGDSPKIRGVIVALDPSINFNKWYDGRVILKHFEARIYDHSGTFEKCPITIRVVYRNHPPDKYNLWKTWAEIGLFKKSLLKWGEGKIKFHHYISDGKILGE